ncbi:MAG: GNAT family N-acetyltransferase [Elusimicrobiota bacterium]|nr:GNAT family N-acetyltransferase [Elusimicrobiota bacterium]
MDKTIMEIDKQKNLAAVKRLYLDSFEDTGEYADFYFANMFKNYRCFGAIQDDDLISMAFVSEKTLLFDGCKIQCPLISAVCTSKKFRNQGCAFKLVEFIKDTLRKERCPAVYLSPINEAVYKKNSFIPFCREENFKIIYNGSSAATLRESNYGDINLLSDLYNSFCSDKNAFTIRDAYCFKDILRRRNASRDIYLSCKEKNYLGERLDLRLFRAYLIYENQNCLGYIFFDGTYWEICAKLEDVCKVKELDGMTISISCGKTEAKTSQMICFLDEESLKNQCGNIEESILNPNNFNFDKY